MPQTTPWSNRPAVAALLSTCAANPPAEQVRVDRHAQNADEIASYDTTTVRALRRMWNEAATQALARSDAGDTNAFAALDAADPLRSQGYSAVPKRFWLSHPVDRIVWVAMQAGAVELERAA